jgi:hypothetical protein
MSLRSILLVIFCLGALAACYGPSPSPYPNANQQNYNGVSNGTSAPSQANPNGKGPTAD